jgi:hypothetical protein
MATTELILAMIDLLQISHTIVQTTGIKGVTCRRPVAEGHYHPLSIRRISTTLLSTTSVNTQEPLIQ